MKYLISAFVAFAVASILIMLALLGLGAYLFLPLVFK